jgi:hypothetical protein
VIALVGALCVALSSCGLIGPPDDPDGVAADFVAALAARDLPMPGGRVPRPAGPGGNFGPAVGVPAAFLGVS